jgi:GNAT superfamily N-acetyltransferase
VTPPPGLGFRRATVADAALLADLASRTFAAAFRAGNSPEDLALHLETHYTPAVMREELAHPGCDTIFALVSGAPVGYAQLFDRAPPIDLGPETRMLHRFYLDPAWIGRGVAGPLMGVVRDSARGQGARSLWLTVWQENPRAIAFYRRSGFTIRGETTFVVGTDPQRDWIMVCAL